MGLTRLLQGFPQPEIAASLGPQCKAQATARLKPVPAGWQQLLHASCSVSLRAHM